jgi:hypothetical protein
MTSFGNGILITGDGIPQGTGSSPQYNTITNTSAASYTIASNDVIINTTTGTGSVVNLPPATGSGRKLMIVQVDTGSGCTVTPNGSDTIQGSATAVTVHQYDKVALIDDISGVWIDLALGGV